MVIFHKIVVSAMLIAAVTLGLVWPIATTFAATSPTLGAAGSYSVLGHTTVTNTGATTMPGDLGISIGGAPVGFPPGTVGPPGSIRNAADSLAAQNANTAAFGFIDQTCDMPAYQFGSGVVDLVGANLVPGVYCADAFTLTGTLTLTGTGVWIFKSASTLITSGTANVVGGDPCNVWWRQISSATLGTNTSLIGSVLSSTSISMLTGASLNGRALVQTGAVTLDTNTITGSTCLSASTSSGGSGGSGGSTGSTTSSSFSSVVPKLPNAGYAPQSGNTLIAIIISAGTLVSLGLSYLVLKRREL